MKFTIEQAPALAAVKKCLSVSGRATTLPILSCVRVTAKSDEVTFLATNLDRWMECRVPAKVKQSGSAAISARKLAAILAAGDEATIEVDGKNKACIMSDGSTFRFPVLAGSEMPDPISPGEGAEVIEMLACDWFNATHSVAWAASNDTTRMALNGVHLTAEDTSLRMIGVDGRRMVVCDMPNTAAPSRGITIPNEAISSIWAISGQEGTLRLEVGHEVVRVTCGDDVITTKLIIDNFPPHKNLIPVRGKGVTKARLPNVSIMEAISRVALMCPNEDPGIMLTFKDHTVQLAVIGNDQESSAVRDVVTEGPEVRIKLSHVFLADPLKKWGVPEVELEMEGDLSPAVLRAENLTCVIMPMRIK